LDQGRIEEAAQLFVRARRTGLRLSDLPEACRPRDAQEANAIVRAVTRLLDQPIGGWKIAFLYKPRQPPLIAPLFAANIFASPAVVPRSVTYALLAEPEIAFRLLHDLPPRDSRYQAAEVAEAVIACPALELNDTRFDTSARSLRSILDDPGSVLSAHADHQTSGAFVVGEGQTGWETADFAEQRVVLRCGESVLIDRIGGHAFSDPFLPVVVLANARRRQGGLKAGQVVAAGSFSGFSAVQADTPVIATFDGFGSAEATFSSAV
jgi:2-keto-4-pentenoate hydratase